MNKQRRKAIDDLRGRIEAFCVDLETHLSGMKGSFEDFETDCDDLASEEREYYDNMPESLQSGAKGSAADTAATSLEEAKEHVSEARDLFEEFLNKLRDEVCSALEAAEDE